jgi:hypothetical protein
MDERIEKLYKAVLGDEGKPLGEMRQAVHRHIVEAEKIVKETTEPDLDDLNNERAVQRFRHAFRAHLVRVAHAKGDMPDHLREVLKILDAHRLEKWPEYRE